MKEPVGYSTYAIWAFITEPFASAHALVYAAALRVTLFVLITSIISRLVCSSETLAAGSNDHFFGCDSCGLPLARPRKSNFAAASGSSPSARQARLVVARCMQAGSLENGWDKIMVRSSFTLKRLI
jgi:hypothetical protein